MARSTIATEKLEPIFKGDLASSVPLIVEFYQNLILLHMGSNAAYKRLEQTIAKMRHSNYLMELILVELNHVLKMKSLTDFEQKAIIGLLGLTVTNLKGGISSNLAQYAANKYRENIQKKLLLKKPAANSDEASSDEPKSA